MRHVHPVTPIILLTLVIFGCTSNDERLVQMAKEHEQRQAEQSQQMARMQHEIAEGSKKLIEADAKARAEMSALQREMQSHQAAIGRERDKMEAERREIAENRFRDPIVAAVITNVGIVLACLLPLALGVYVLRAACRAGESDSAVAELLVQEIVPRSLGFCSRPLHRSPC